MTADALLRPGPQCSGAYHFERVAQGTLPLPADDDVDAVLFEKIRSGEYDADDPIWDSISEQVQHSALVRAHVDAARRRGTFLISDMMLLTQAKDLVAQLLVVDPSQRLSAKEALAHPWIQARVLLQDRTRLHLQALVQTRGPASVNCLTVLWSDYHAGMRTCSWARSLTSGRIPTTGSLPQPLLYSSMHISERQRLLSSLYCRASASMEQRIAWNRAHQQRPLVVSSSPSPLA